MNAVVSAVLIASVVLEGERRNSLSFEAMVLVTLVYL